MEILIRSIGAVGIFCAKSEVVKSIAKLNLLLVYKISHLVENACARLKYFRGIATGYDELKLHYENSVAFACSSD